MPLFVPYITMNSLMLALLPLVVSATPGNVAPRQLGGGLGGLEGLFGDPMVPESVEELPPEIFPEAKRTVTRWGPYKLVGHDVC